MLGEAYMRLGGCLNTTNFPLFQKPTGPSETVAEYYRLRFEAGEDRYNRMKGLVRAALEKVRCIERENKDLRVAGKLSGLGLQPLHYDSLLSAFVGRGEADNAVLKSSIESLVLELDRVRGDNSKLIEHNRQLRESGNRMGVPMEDRELNVLYLDAISQAREFKPTIAKLKAQIMAMEFDWTQAKNMRDELFDFDEKLREHETVANAMCLKPTHSTGATVFATSRRQMLEILVEDRNRNINGYYARHVVPLERLRAEKDSEILELRMMVRKLEIVSGVSSVEAVAKELSEIEVRLVDARNRFSHIQAGIQSGEMKMKELGEIIKNFQDHANDWKFAHDEATSIIQKAEKMRSEYDGLMASLRAEDDRVMAKKKALERRKDVNGSFNRMRDIDEEMEVAEGELAVKDMTLKRVTALIESKNKAIAAQKQILSALEREMADDVMEQDCLSTGLNNVRV